MVLSCPRHDDGDDQTAQLLDHYEGLSPPGERWDAIVLADSPGAWAFHCHILSHAESPQGMFGMVSVFIVE